MGLKSTVRGWLHSVTKFIYYYAGGEAGFKPLLRLPSKAGVNASPEEVQRVDAVFACARAIAEPIASTTRKVIKLQGEAKELQPKHRVTRLVTEYPNSYQTAHAWFERALYHMVLWGEHFAYIFRDREGFPVELRMIHPSLVSDYRFDQETGIMWWRVDPGDTYRDPLLPTGWLPHHDMIHVPILSNGIRGRSVLTAYRDDFATSIATRDFGNEYFANSGKPSVWVETTDQTITPEQNKAFSQQMREQRHGNMMLPWGRKLHQLSIPPNDSQFIETKMFNVETTARIFNVPPPMIQHFKDGANYSNLETLTRNYASVTLFPYTSKVESEYTWKLFSTQERFRGYQIEFDFSSLLKADPKTRAEVASKYVQNAIRTPNELRATDGLEALQGGNDLLIQQNMAQLKNLEKLLMAKHGNRNNNNNGQDGSATGSNGTEAAAASEPAGAASNGQGS